MENSIILFIVVTEAKSMIILLSKVAILLQCQYIYVSVCDIDLCILQPIMQVMTTEEH